MDPQMLPLRFRLLPEDNKDIVEAYRDSLEKHLQAALVKRWEMIESYMLIHMAGTGFRPDQLELCEMSDESGKITWIIRPLPGVPVTEGGKADPCHVRLVSDALYGEQ